MAAQLTRSLNHFKMDVHTFLPASSETRKCESSRFPLVDAFSFYYLRVVDYSMENASIGSSQNYNIRIQSDWDRCSLKGMREIAAREREGGWSLVFLIEDLAVHGNAVGQWFERLLAALLSLIKRIRWKDFANPLLMENYYLNAALYSLALAWLLSPCIFNFFLFLALPLFSALSLFCRFLSAKKNILYSGQIKVNRLMHFSQPFRDAFQKRY